MSKFNVEAAEKVIAAVRKAMAVSDELNLWDRQRLPSVVKQDSGWNVDPKELAQFERVIDVLVSGIFGVDSDADQALKWMFINRKTDATDLPAMRIPRTKLMERDENKLWAAL